MGRKPSTIAQVVGKIPMLSVAIGPKERPQRPPIVVHATEELHGVSHVLQLRIGPQTAAQPVYSELVEQIKPSAAHLVLE
jgi:hypothetical protein